MSRWFSVVVMDTQKISASHKDNTYHLPQDHTFLTQSEKQAKRLGRSLASQYPNREVHVMQTSSFGVSKPAEPTIYVVNNMGEEFPE